MEKESSLRWEIKNSKGKKRHTARRLEAFYFQVTIYNSYDEKAQKGAKDFLAILSYSYSYDDSSPCGISE